MVLKLVQCTPQDPVVQMLMLIAPMVTLNTMQIQWRQPTRSQKAEYTEFPS